MKTEEQVYTSTTTKLLKHGDRLKDIQQGIWTPITLQLAPTDKCNLNCTMCSVKNRAGDEMTFDNIMTAVHDLQKYGLESVELTGGGDPTMYPQINSLIECLYNRDLQIGMITNGVVLQDKVTQENLDKLTWLRISLNGLDQGLDAQIPKIKGDLSFSYVWNDDSIKHASMHIMDTKYDSVLMEEHQALTNVLDHIEVLYRLHNAKFVRVVPDCFSKEKIDYFKENFAQFINAREGFFAQTKSVDKPDRCWIGYLKPFLNSDGYFYYCSANPLIEGKFNKKHRMGRFDKVRKIWTDVKPFDTKVCGICFFEEHNKLLEEVLEDVPHSSFI